MGVEHSSPFAADPSMPSDSVMVALIAEAMGGHSLARRTAAGLLLDLLGSGDTLAAKQETVETKATAEVTQQLRALIAEHGLNGPNAPRS